MNPMDARSLWLPQCIDHGLRLRDCPRHDFPNGSLGCRLAQGGAQICENSISIEGHDETTRRIGVRRRRIAPPDSADPEEVDAKPYGVGSERAIRATAVRASPGFACQ
jgi:hypothetical protein